MTMPEPMSGDEFKTAMDRISLVVGLLREEPIDRLVGMVDWAQTLGPLLEPTAYMRGGGDNLRDQAEILHAAAALVAASDRVLKRRGVSL